MDMPAGGTPDGLGMNAYLGSPGEKSLALEGREDQAPLLPADSKGLPEFYLRIN